MGIRLILDKAVGFEWDKGNRFKSWLKHHVKEIEAEEVFFNELLLLIEDKKHSQGEDRFLALGCTDQGRCLFVFFTIRKVLVRIISARDMHKKEKVDYEKFKNNPQF
jgi:uncharacterized protein